MIGELRSGMALRDFRTSPTEQFRIVPVIAQDPGVRTRDGRGPILMARISIPAEDLARGPTGYRVQIVDYDATRGRYGGAHDLSSEPLEWDGGDLSIVDDPVFRAHNVYAIVMRTLASFEFALGRRVGWAFEKHQIKVAPAGMADANAFYSREDEGLVFGYFRGNSGADVYTCLSHDVVAHETTHALLDGLRPRFLFPSTADQAAFHEGFADVIALLSVYAQREIVRALLRPLADKAGAMPLSKIEVEQLRKSALFRLADQMGEELAGVRGEALRESAGLKPDPGLLGLDEYQECHRRGEVFVAAVLRAFLSAWVGRVQRAVVKGQRRVSVYQVAEDGADVAAALTTMWIRALDYLPPSDLEFGDALSAALTADFEVRRDDSRFELRRHVRETFASFGIHPASSRSVPEEGMWKPAPSGLRYDRVRFESMQSNKDEMFRFLWENRSKGRLNLSTDAFTQVLTIHPCVRVGEDGFTLRETVATYYQVARMTIDELEAKGIEIPETLREEVEELRRQRKSDRDEAEKKAEEKAKSQAGPQESEANASPMANTSSEDGDAERGGAREADEPVALNDRVEGSVDQGSAGSADDGDPLFAVYGGATLIFDEYGHVKYCIHSDVFGTKQSQRLRYLWDTGALSVDNKHGARVSGMRLSGLHRQRATGVGLARRGW